MSESSISAARTSLFVDLRWVVRLRFLAAGALLVGAGVDTFWSPWESSHLRVVVLAIVTLTYNFAFLFARSRCTTTAAVRIVGWSQIALDLIGLTLLTLWTGGMQSPLLWAFLPLLVLISMLLHPPGQAAYIASVISILMVFGGLRLTDQWPTSVNDIRYAIMWMITLFFVSLIANHIAATLRQRERTVRRQERINQSIVETAVEGIITIDVTGLIQSANPAAAEMFGYEVEDLLGRNVSMLMPEPHRSDHDSFLAAYLATGQARIIGIGREVRGLRSNGQEFPLDLSVSEVTVDGLHLFTGIVRDITERNESQRRLTEMNQQLIRQREAMIQHEKMAAMGHMAAGITHEISNPLACMDSVLQLAERNPARFKPETLQVFREQIDRIRKTMKELSGFSHPDSGPWEVIAVNELVEGSLAMVRFDHRIRDIEVTRDLGTDVGDVRLMPNAIRQVLVNLMINALDAMADSDHRRLTLRTVVAEPGIVRIDVEDTGPGISPRNLDRLFEPFFTTKPVGKGTGLGLAISYSLVEKHGGRLDVQTEQGKGTRFSLHLPRTGPGSDGREVSEADIPESENTPPFPAR